MAMWARRAPCRAFSFVRPVRGGRLRRAGGGRCPPDPPGYFRRKRNLKDQGLALRGAGRAVAVARIRALRVSGSSQRSGSISRCGFAPG